MKENIQNYQTQILGIQQTQQELVKQLEEMTSSIQDYNAKIHVLTKEQNARYQDLRQNEGIYNHAHLSLDKEQYAQVEKEEDGLLRRIDELEKHIQKVSAKLVVQKFGSDQQQQQQQPFRVKVNVMDLRGEVSFFIMELAPISEMPYAVYYFLQMVDQKLWDGLALMLNGGTTATTANHWMATTMQMDIRFGQHSWEGKRFEDANLKHMAFTEHSTAYPPQGKFQYSVAFSGHPGGPSFYIRLDQDSAEEHISDIHQQSTTFAIVVEGTDVLRQYSAGATRQIKIDSNEGNNNNQEDNPQHGGKSDHVRMLTIQSMELLVLWSNKDIKVEARKQMKETNFSAMRK